MNLQSLIGLASFVSTLACPVVVVGALIVLRTPFRESLTNLGQRIDKISLAGFSLELMDASELKPRSLDTEPLEINAGKQAQSGLHDLLTQFREPGRFVTLVENDRTFRSLIDRSTLLESLAKNYARQTK